VPTKHVFCVFFACGGPFSTAARYLYPVCTTGRLLVLCRLCTYLYVKAIVTYLYKYCDINDVIHSYHVRTSGDIDDTPEALIPANHNAQIALIHRNNREIPTSDNPSRLCLPNVTKHPPLCVPSSLSSNVFQVSRLFAPNRQVY
jgi:hypothetical protein